MMDREKKYQGIVFIIGFIGVINLAAGVLSSLYISEINLSERISAIKTTIGSFDPGLVKTIPLQAAISNIQDSVSRELSSLMSYSNILSVIPIYFILNGILFIALSVVLRFLMMQENSPEDSS